MTTTAQAKCNFKGSGTWTTLSGSGYIDISAGSASKVVLVTATNDIKSYSNENGTFYLWPGGGKAFKAMIDEDGVMYVIGLDNTVFGWNTTSSLWKQLAGGRTFSYCSNGGSIALWCVGPTVNGSNLYVLSDQGLVGAQTISGTTVCPQGCFAYHTPHVKGQWTSGKHVNTTGAVSYGNAVLATDQMLFSSGDNCYDIFDLVALDPNAPSACGGFQVLGGIDCSLGGPNFYNPGGVNMNFTYSEYYHSYDQTILSDTITKSVPGFVEADSLCSMSVNACLPGTTAVCNPNTSNNLAYVTEDGVGWAKGTNVPQAELIAAAISEAHFQCTLLSSPAAARVSSFWTQAPGGPVVCKPQTKKYAKNAKINQPCF